MKLLVKLVKDVMNMIGMTLPKPHQERKVALVALALTVFLLVGMVVAAGVLLEVTQH